MTIEDPPYEDAMPPAASAIEALRGIGYNVRTAIADLVDNSISAGARTIRIDFVWAGVGSSISILDDGSGMTDNELSRAMRLGSRNPLEERAEGDLGRFGLGLKTASFSQSRRLIVGSKCADGEVAVRQWDLDYVQDKDLWRVLLIATPESTSDLARLGELKAGTLVRWEALDHVVGDAAEGDAGARERFYRLVEKVRDHLGMVFHRFLSERPAVSIFINGDRPQHRVQPWDPFCTDEPATTPTPDQGIPFAGRTMMVTGFVLPHRDKFSSPEALESAAGPDGWSAHQGFYVYRNRRLLLAGGWLGLGRERSWTREEHFKLARLRLDIPNSLDSYWQIDVRKAVARPPALIRAQLTDLAECVRMDARRVFAHRGQYRPRTTALPVAPTWQATSDAKGNTAYRVNTSHPLIEDILARDSVSRAEVRRLLRLLEATVPVQQVWLDLAERPERQADPRTSLDEAELLTMAEDLVQALMITRNFSRDQAVAEVQRSEPFNLFPSIMRTLSGINGAAL